MNDDAARTEALRSFAGRMGFPLDQQELLDQALTHASSVAEKADPAGRDYEALEFLGDAVLELAVSHYLFDVFPGQTPGEYTKLRAAIVNRKSVARAAREMDLASLVRLGKGEEQCGGRRRTALLADCLEAVIGAVYLDVGWLEARDFVMRVFAREFETIRRSPPVWDYKSLLQQHCQAVHIALPRFELVHCDGPDHHKHFEIEVYVKEQRCGSGCGFSKKEAEQNAAHQALLALDVLV